MDLDYDIYSYLAKGLGSGLLEPHIFSEKVFYEIVDYDSINLNEKKLDNLIRVKLQVIDKYGKKIYNEDGSPLFMYEDKETLNSEYVKALDRRNMLKKKASKFIFVQVPYSIKVPLNIKTNKFIKLEKNKWIDITNISKLKFYSNNKVKLLFEMIDDNVKTKKMS